MATSTRTRKRQRLTAGEREAMQNEALDRAQHGRTNANDLVILSEFAARGIDAHPREDCYTFNAWRALGRHVRKGEHGVRVAVYVHTDEVKDDGTTQAHSYPTSATVFHVSQTDPDEPRTPAAIEADTLSNIEATQRQDTEADDREEAEDAHERALLEQEQREEARTTTDAEPATLF